MTQLTCFKEINISNDQITEEENPKCVSGFTFQVFENKVKFNEITCHLIQEPPKFLLDLIFLFDPSNIPILKSCYQTKFYFFSIL